MQRNNIKRWGNFNVNPAEICKGVVRSRSKIKSKREEEI